ncbi:MAG TPA: response regulator [Verrucomicrobiales bacterium]|nr:response regulator [Verrucomicrobiales bacterium]
MNPTSPDHPFAVLLVDDEEKSLKYFRRLFERLYPVYTAANAEEGFELIRAHREEIAVILSDQRMPGQQGVQFLERVRREYPEPIRVLSTAYADIDAAVDSVNLGEIYRYVTKPWDLPELEILLQQAMELFVIRRERNALLKEKLASMHNLLAADRIMSLALVGFARKNALRRVGAAMESLLQLVVVDKAPEEFSLDEMRDPGYWRHFHDYHCGILQRVLGCLEQEFARIPDIRGSGTQTRLGDLAGGLGGEWSGGAGAGGEAAWPVDPELAGVLLRSLLAALQPFDGGGEKLRLNITGGADEPRLSVEVSHPAFQEHLVALVSPTVRLGPSTDLAAGLLAAYFALYHHGGSVEAAENRPEICRLEIGFLPEAAMGDADPSKELIRDLISNELFWSRIFRSW